MSEPSLNIKVLEASIFAAISTAQRNGMSTSEAISVGIRPFLEKWLNLEKPHDLPNPGDPKLCLICAYEKPWGVFDPKTGASVCKECRDKAWLN